MYAKFYPHFVGYEEDLKSEMMIALINAIKRIKRGEITSEQNYIITHLKYEVYKLAKKMIDYDRCTFYLEDFKPFKNNDATNPVSWENAFKRFGIANIEKLPDFFESYEEKYMCAVLLGLSGYTKTQLRDNLQKGWPYVNELEERVKEKLVELIKLYSGENTNGK